MRRIASSGSKNSIIAGLAVLPNIAGLCADWAITAVTKILDHKMDMAYQIIWS
jgi:hypothetical protein